MSLAALQASYARIVTDSDGADDLSERELEQLRGFEDDAGLGVVKMLYRSWRLTKVLSLLPLTTGSIPTDELSELLGQFWQGRQAVGPYFVEECLAFLDFLSDCEIPRSDRLLDLIAFERARLELHDEVAAGAPSAERHVVLRHRPSRLFAPDTGDECPPPEAESTVHGQVDEHGNERWIVTTGPDSGMALRVGAPAH